MAFCGCSNLQEITIPDSVATIDSSAFAGCSKLQEITIPDSVTTIGNSAFSECSSLQRATLGSSVTIIDDYAFYKCNSLQKVTLGGGVTTIGGMAFCGCSNLQEITIPDSVTTIGNSAFSECSSLQRATLGSGVTTIGSRAFDGCDSLQEITIPDSVTSIGNSAFAYCGSLPEITIPDGVTTIGNSAFAHCDSLQEITIPDSVTTIGDKAFLGCYDLRTVEFLGNAPAIGKNVFPVGEAGEFVLYYHSGATGWTSPLWNGYYAACSEGEISEFSALDAENRNSQGLLFTLNDTSMTAVVGDNSDRENNSGYYGNNGGCVVIPADVTKDGKTYQVIGIGQYAFDCNLTLKSVVIGPKVTSIDSTAFLDTPSLQSFAVAEGSTSYSAADGVLFDAIGYYLYRYPAGKSDSSYTVPDNVKNIGPYAFANVHALTELALPDDLRSIGKYALKKCDNLTELVIPDAVQTIGTAALVGCSKLQTLTVPFFGKSRSDGAVFGYLFDVAIVPDSLKTVIVTGDTLPREAFAYCYDVESIFLPAQDAVPEKCFYNCESLTRLVFAGTEAESEHLEPGQVMIPGQITEIGEYAFSGCTSLTEFIVAEDNPNYCSDQWGVLYTKDMTALISYPASRKWPYYNVSEKTKTLEAKAFYGCANLVNLYIPNSVTQFKSSCVYACPGMTICAYTDSEAYTYADDRSLNVWPMDNYTLQGIEIYALPEQVVQKGEDALRGLYVTANYGGKALQLDNYTVSYDPDKSGVQTVTVSFDGYTECFQILLYDGETEYLADFGQVQIESGTVGYIALYDEKGKMLKIEDAVQLDGRVVLVTPKTEKVQTAKLFLLKEGSLVPVGTPVKPRLENDHG